MAKSSRSSAIKKNNQRLKKRVFGPVETARNERQSAKLLELAQQPKPLRPEMEVEQDANSDSKAEKASGDADDTVMEVEDNKDPEDPPTTRSNRSIDKQRHARGKRIEKRHRKAKNNISFKKHPLKPGKKPSKR